MFKLALQLFAISGLHRIVHGMPLENTTFDLHPFHIDLSSGVPRMLDQIRDTQLPEQFPYSGVGTSLGIGLDDLKALRTEWMTDFNWEKEQDSMNELKHFTSIIEGLTIHFVHEKSNETNAIPLLLIHGWPGSFLEFAPIINQLTKEAETSTGSPVSFDVIVPSLPGFAFSSSPPVNWTIQDTARVFNTLMTDVLGYNTYAIHGTDWGSAIAYKLYDQYNRTIGTAHFAFLPFYPEHPDQLSAENIALSEGDGYFIEQTTKPNTLGLALQDNPVGQLAWIGEKFMNWSDPNAGTSPSLLNHNEVLRSVSLYYLTGTFASSVLIYSQNPNTWKAEYSKAHTDAPMLFSAFKYNVAFWPSRLVAKVGNLVLYRNHDFGGHFPGLDNPLPC